MTTYITVACTVAVLDDGTVLLVPQDAEFLARAKTFTAGTATATWDEPVTGQSGNTYRPLLLFLEQEDERLAVGLIPPAGAEQHLEGDEPRHAVILLDEPVEDPFELDLMIAQGIHLHIPPLSPGSAHLN